MYTILFDGMTPTTESSDSLLLYTLGLVPAVQLVIYLTLQLCAYVSKMCVSVSHPLRASGLCLRA